ncbi:MAG TPA: DUF6491 family protein [Luteimonas sp.]|nr:DUF6491 family protein [Luteimonas sp.]
MSPRLLLAASITTLLAAGCATTPRMSDAESLALYTSHAGDPVKSVRYRDPISWDKVDDQHLILTMRPREVYLVKINGPCLDWGSASPSISIDAPAGFINPGVDKIRVPSVPVGCRIEEMREVDIAAVREARRAMDAAR